MFSFRLAGYIFILVFVIFWGYSHLFWTQMDLTLTPGDEQACFDAFSLYATTKVVHEEHIHPKQVNETLWGPLPYYLYSIGMDVFGNKLSSIRETIAFCSGLWGGILYLIICLSTKRPVFSFFFTLFFIPFSGHLNFNANRGYAHFYSFILQALSMLLVLLWLRRRRIWPLLLIGLIQGISFGFKYEHSLLGVLAAILTLLVLETIETYNRIKKEQQLESANGKLKYLAARTIIKILPLLGIFLYSLYLIRLGFLPQLLLIFWLACLTILFLELKLAKAHWQKPVKPDSAIAALIINIAAVLIPFLLVVIFLFLHLWQMTSLEVMKDYLKLLLNTPVQIEMMRLSSPAISNNNLAYFINTHPISFIQIITWSAYAFIASGVLFFVRSAMIKGIVTGAALFIIFYALRINQINIFSIYYFIAAISLFLWVYFFSSIQGYRIIDLPPEFIVYLCFLAAGSLALLRESASLDINIWPVFPPLLGILTFMASRADFFRKVRWINTACFIVIFYFCIECWAQVEGLNFLYSRVVTPLVNVKRIDQEFDLLIPADTAAELQRMKAEFEQNLGRDEHIFIFSNHFYPYLFAPNGFPAKYLITFQVPDEREEQRMLQVFRDKNIKYVLFSEGINAYNSKRAAEMFPGLSAFILRNYKRTGKKFLNFAVYQRIL